MGYHTEVVLALLDGYQKEAETMVVGVAGASSWQQEQEEEEV